MSKKTRVVIAFIVVELLLAGLWYFLIALRADQGADGPNDGSTQAAVESISSTMGMAMGGLLGIFFILYLIAAKNDRQAK